MLVFKQQASVCKVSGELSQAAVIQLWPSIEGLFEQTVERLDLSDISYSDSAGVALLLHLVAEQHALGRELELCGAPAQLQKLIELYDLQDFFIEEAK